MFSSLLGGDTVIKYAGEGETAVMVEKIYNLLLSNAEKERRCRLFTIYQSEGRELVPVGEGKLHPFFFNKKGRIRRERSQFHPVRSQEKKKR